jgi:hypothetical protein
MHARASGFLVSSRAKPFSCVIPSVAEGPRIFLNVSGLTPTTDQAIPLDTLLFRSQRSRCGRACQNFFPEKPSRESRDTRISLLLTAPPVAALFTARRRRDRAPRRRLCSPPRGARRAGDRTLSPNDWGRALSKSLPEEHAKVSVCWIHYVESFFNLSF